MLCNKSIAGSVIRMTPPPLNGGGGIERAIKRTLAENWVRGMINLKYTGRFSFEDDDDDDADDDADDTTRFLRRDLFKFEAILIAFFATPTPCILLVVAADSI